ncbi:MAG: polyribonucleotide nucleotidyltransferase, partial [Planctomycetota bacterium]
MPIHSVTIDVGGRPLTIETGRMARLAAGSVVVSFGEAMVLSGASVSGPKAHLPFFPLTIDYREKNYSSGKIPGGFLKREGPPSPKEILTMRMTDRPIRPLWPKGYRNDTQVQSFVISYDQLNDPDVLSITGAGAALSLANVPFFGPIAGVRVGLAGDEYVAYPDNEVRAQSPLDMVVAGTKDSVTMVEGGADELSEEIVIGAIAFGHDVVRRICEAIEDLRAQIGWTMPAYEDLLPDENAVAAVRTRFFDALDEAIHTPTKLERTEAMRAVRDEILEALGESEDDGDGKGRFALGDLKGAIEVLEKEIIRAAALSGSRIDGRRTDEIRPIDIEVGLLPRAHGSALFTRGETQALVTTTLGTGLDEKLVDGLQAQAFTKKYYLHYNFPPMCVGETRPIRGPSRREIGHGALAERALLPVLPAMDDFPYTIRIVSDILMSNGSSSMASVCGTTLSLMDAGVQIARPVAGIAMGLVSANDDVVVLTDILGDEDHAGDMDFKVTGSQRGITALQMDIKMKGISQEILQRALEQAHEGRIFILKKMLQAIDRPREEYNQYAPRVETVRIPPAKIGALIGPGGKNIRRIQEETGATIEVDDTGMVKIFSTEAAGANAARAQVEAIAEEATLGKIYDGKVTSVKDFGAFLEIIPGIEGLCHISELADGYVGRVTDVLNLGDLTPVKVILVDDSGRVKLSRKQALH